MSQKSEESQLEAMIRESIACDSPEFDEQAWRERFSSDLAEMRAWDSIIPNNKNTLSRVRTRSWPKIARMLAVAGAVALLAFFWNGLGNQRSALAGYLLQLSGGSYTFQVDSSNAGVRHASAKGMVLEPGRLRMELQEGIGSVVGLYDAATGEYLTILHDRKYARRMGPDDMPDGTDDASSIFFLNRSINDLWNLKTGGEIQLGEKLIDGVKVEGFEVTEVSAGAIRTIRVWANPATDWPVEVEIDSKSEKMTWNMKLTDIQPAEDLNPDLFSMTPPDGYTFANSVTLADLERQQSGSDTIRSEGAEQFLEILRQWDAGQEEAAITLSLSVDWDGEFRFIADDRILTTTEMQFVRLRTDDQKQFFEEFNALMGPVRGVCRKLLALGEAAQASGDYVAAEQYYKSTIGLDRVLLTATPNGTLIVRTLGLPYQREANRLLAEMYAATGESEKRAEAQAEFDRLEKVGDTLKSSVKPLGR